MGVSWESSRSVVGAAVGKKTSVALGVGGFDDYKIP